jgi:hypothetical protein
MTSSFASHWRRHVRKMRLRICQPKKTKSVKAASPEAKKQSGGPRKWKVMVIANANYLIPASLALVGQNQSIP